MTDPVETDVEKILADVRAKTKALAGDDKTEFTKVQSYVKLHITVIIGIVSFIVGAILGHLIK